MAGGRAWYEKVGSTVGIGGDRGGGVQRRLRRFGWLALITLTDPRMKDTADLAPATVPSGLPVDVAAARQFPIYE